MMSHVKLLGVLYIIYHALGVLFALVVFGPCWYGVGRLHVLGAAPRRYCDDVRRW